MLACAGAVVAAPTSGFGSEEALISKVPFILSASMVLGKEYNNGKV